MSELGNMRTATIAILSAALVLMGGLTSCGKAQTAQTLILEARQYQQAGDHKAAIIQLKNALQKNPDSVEARYVLGTIYNQSGDAKSAEKEFRRALGLGMKPAKVLPELGNSLLAQGQFQQVLDEITPGAKESAEISTLRGNAYLALDQSRQAQESFLQALRNKPDYPAALIGLSRQALAENNITVATGFSEQVANQNPQNADAWLFKGDLLRTKGKVEPALAAYDHVLKLQPDNTAAHINKALLEISTGTFEAAQTDIEAARKTNPDNLLVFYTQALLDFRQGKSAPALESLQQVLRAAPELMPSVLLAGAVQYSLGSMHQAEQHLDKYLKKYPDNLYARKLLASALMKSGQTQSAIDVLSPELKDSQQDMQLLALAGEAYMLAGDYPRAKAYLSRASVLAPKAAELHTALGLSKLALGENELATAEMETAVQLDTRPPLASALLAMTRLRLKEYDKALLAAKAIENAQPGNPLAHNLKGAAYLGKKDFANARASFEKALSLQPANFPAAENLAQLDLRDQKPEVAKKRFERMLEKDQKNIQLMTALANLAISQGQIKEASTWLENASRENPEELQPSLQLIAHYLRTGAKQQALLLSHKLKGSNAGNPAFLDVLAQVEFANNDMPGALKTYARLATARPDAALVQFRIASIHLAMQNPSAAMAALKKALTLQPAYLDAQLMLASLESERGNYQQALAIALQIQKQDSKSPAGYELEGNLLMQRKNPDLAAQAYEQAFALSQTGPLMVKLHAALVQTGKGRAAGLRLTLWLKEHPADLTTRIYQAGIYLADQQYQAAIDQYQTILSQTPDYMPAMNNLAWLYQQEKIPHALQYAEKARQLAPDNPQTLDTLGWILVEKGNTARGLTLLQQAILLTPKDAEIRYHLALGFMKSGDKAKARKELEQTLSSGNNFSRTKEAQALLKQL